MAEDPEKRFHAIMDKLFHDPKSSPPLNSSTPSSSSSSSFGLQLSKGQKRQHPSFALALVEPKSRSEVAEALRNSSASSGSSDAPMCRPWERGDLMRRLATFKSMTWFAKPKVASAVNCARRGWINVGMDMIACEACGARLLFTTPSSWNQQQVEKAGLVFSLKLDNGHKLLCPWIDNACDETLAQFPPTPAPALVAKFRERSLALAHLLALPVISSSTIERISNTQLEQFLESLHEFDYGHANNSDPDNLRNEHESDRAKLYYQANKLISLCGWEPRSLPYVVYSNAQSVNRANILGSSHFITKGRTSVSLSPSSTTENMEERNVETYSGLLADPNSVVLDCRLCGASVGLWAFSVVPRPVEVLRLAGYTDVNGDHNSNSGNHIDTALDGATSERSSNLNLTIAGGPPPTRQNFKAAISLPIIGRSLRVRLSRDLEFIDRIYSDQEKVQGDSQDKGCLEKRYHAESTPGELITQTGDLSISQNKIDEYQCNTTAINEQFSSLSQNSCGKGDTVVKENDSHISVERTNATVQGSTPESGVITEILIESTPNVHQSLADNNEWCENSGNAGPHISVQLDPCSSQAPEKGIPLSKENHTKQGPSDKAVEFDPIRQHKHFCPWIASTGNVAPGWKQTHSALHREKGCSSSSPKNPPSASIIKVDDPVKSVRRLFTSSAKKLKSSLASPQSNGQ